ncbi:MAG: helix-turn-helix domain-containing protein [Leptospirales bacterium]|jgi:AraC-like DNA-binding protein
MKANSGPRYREFLVSPALRGLAIAGCDIQALSFDANIRVLPDACDYLLYQEKRGLCVLSGRRENHEEAVLAAGGRVSGYKLRPGAMATILGVDARDVAGQGLIPLQEFIFPMNPRRKQIFQTYAARFETRENQGRSYEDLLAALTMGLAREADRLDSRAKLELLGDLQSRFATHPEATLGALAKQNGMSLRTLERRVREACGLSPARFRSIVRFFAAYRMMNLASAENLTAVAHGSGYSDQAHFIRDFRRFAGLRPRDAKRHPERYGLNPAPARVC